MKKWIKKWIKKWNKWILLIIIIIIIIIICIINNKYKENFEIEEPKLYDENDNIIDIKKIERTEQDLANKYIEKNDIVLELGARYGTVSVIINKRLKEENKEKHYVVEPDSNVWEALEKNKRNHNSKFKIIKGMISKTKHKLSGDSNYSTQTIQSNEGDINIYEIPNEEFNVLIVDCEGCFEEFYNEYPEFVNKLDKIILECDYKNEIDYKKIINKLITNNYYIRENINNFHYVFMKKK